MLPAIVRAARTAHCALTELFSRAPNVSPVREQGALQSMITGTPWIFSSLFWSFSPSPASWAGLVTGDERWFRQRMHPLFRCCRFGGPWSGALGSRGRGGGQLAALSQRSVARLRARARDLRFPSGEGSDGDGFPCGLSSANCQAAELSLLRLVDCHTSWRRM
jgi:hypothetical protein